jgi:hypothetical protein
MTTYEEKSKELQELSFNKRIFTELSTLVRNNVITREVRTSVDGFEIVKGFEFRLDYNLYKHNDQPIYAFISKTTNREDGSPQYYVYELDYTRPDVVKELITYSKQEKTSRTEMIVTMLNFFGVLLCIFGIIGAFIVLEDSVVYFFTALVSFGVTALLFFALAAILTHLKSIDEKLKDKE